MKTLAFRPMSADWLSIRQVFGEDQFAFLAGIPYVKVIVDLGAYSGYASYYLKSLYSEAKLIAVEPQEIPFTLCKQNLEGLSDVHIIKAAVWHTYVNQLYLVRTRKDKQFFHETATRVTSKKVGSSVACITMEQIFKRFKLSKIDLLKVDIENSERTLFQREFATWLSKVRNIAIEFHSAEAKSTLLDTLLDYRYDLLRRGEIYLFKNIKKRI